VSIQISPLLADSGGVGEVTVKVNNAVWNNMQSQWGGSNNWTYSVLLYLGTNDYVSVGDWQGYTGAVVYTGHSNFSGFLVG